MIERVFHSIPLPELLSHASALSITDLVAGVNWAIFWMVAVMFVIIEGLLLVAAVRFRSHNTDLQTARARGDTKAEIFWTIVPALVTAVILVVAWQTMLAQ